MARKSGLGRGLNALIPGGEAPPPSGVVNIPVNRIVPNPRQPRAHFDTSELDDLSASILEYGIIQPVIVSFDDSSSQYTLIAGERRWMAAQQAGLESIPAIIRDVNDQQRIELALIENVQRSDLSPLEAAEAYRQLSEEFGLSHEQISQQVGKSRVTISNTLRLLKLPPDVKKALSAEQITEGHARALLALPNPDAQSAALQIIRAKELSVRQTEELVRKLTGEKQITHTALTQSPESRALEEQLRTRLGTKVKLNQRQNGGTIVIHYYSTEELSALMDLLLAENG